MVDGSELSDLRFLVVDDLLELDVGGNPSADLCLLLETLLLLLLSLLLLLVVAVVMVVVVVESLLSFLLLDEPFIDELDEAGDVEPSLVALVFSFPRVDRFLREFRFCVSNQSSS